MAAAKHPEPFWRKQTNGSDVQIVEKSHRLSPEKSETYRLYHELMSRSLKQPEPPPTRSGWFVVQVVDDFLEWAKCNRATAIYDIDNRLGLWPGAAGPDVHGRSDLVGKTARIKKGGGA